MPCLYESDDDIYYDRRTDKLGGFQYIIKLKVQPINNQKNIKRKLKIQKKFAKINTKYRLDDLSWKRILKKLNFLNRHTKELRFYKKIEDIPQNHKNY